VTQVDQWDRCTLGGIELPGVVDLDKIRKVLSSTNRFAVVFPKGYEFEIITPSGDDLARWEGEGGDP
jgi:hypothetical protein